MAVTSRERLKDCGSRQFLMAHLSLMLQNMTRAVRLVFCFAFVLVGNPRVSDAPGGRGPAVRHVADVAVSAEIDPSSVSVVRLENELVRVPVTVAAPVRPRNDVVRHARAQPAQESSRLTSRARRMLFGDGTHRPEPFPRPSRN